MRERDREREGERESLAGTSIVLIYLKPRENQLKHNSVK